MTEESINNSREKSLLLISTFYLGIPFGIRSLASLLRSKGVSTDVLMTRSISRMDVLFRKTCYRIPNNKFVEEFIKFVRPYITVGFCVTTDHLHECIYLSELIKNNYPEKIIIFGGVHATVKPRECLKYADYVCVGEGFIAFPNLMLGLKCVGKLKQKVSYYFSYIPSGIWSKDLDSNIIENGCGPSLHNLGDLPPPLYDTNHFFVRSNDNHIVSLDRINYRKYIGNFYHTMTSLGCPNNCAYCCNSFLKTLLPPQDSLRWRPPHMVIDEIVTMKNAYGISVVKFEDDAQISMPDKYLDQFCNEYKNEVALPFISQGIIPSVAARNKEKLIKLMDSGMVRAKVGIQTGSGRMLAIYKRFQKAEDILETAAVMFKYKKHKVVPIFDVITDGYQEEPEDIFKTIKLLNQLPRPFELVLYGLRYFPGSEISKRSGIDHTVGDWYLSFKGTIGNLLIQTATLIRLPKYVLAWIEAHARVLVKPCPTIIFGVAGIVLAMQRTASHIMTRDYHGMPMWFKYLDKRFRK